MSLQYSPKIVTDSLVMCLDASNNKSYPTDLPVKNGLLLWLDAADDSTFSYSSGTEVSQWRDKSGNNFHANQATVGIQPSRNTVVNSRKSVNFTSTNGDRLRVNSGMVFTNSVTAIVFIKPGAQNYDYANILDQDHGMDGANGWVIQRNGNGSNWQSWVANAAGDSWFNPNQVSYTDNTPQIVTLRKGSSTVTLYSNGTSSGDVAVADQQIRQANYFGLNLGSWRAGNEIHGSSRHYNGEICEIVVYNRILSDTERKQVHTYLGQKWGISNTDRSIVDLSNNNYNGSFGGAAGSQTVANMPDYDSYNKGTLTFNGSSDEVNFGDVIKFTATQDFTLEVWVNYLPNATSYVPLLSKEDSPGFGYALKVDETYSYQPYLVITGTTSAYRYANVNINDGVWHHIVGVAKASSTTIDMYVDGVLINGIASLLSWAGTATTNALRLGKNYGSAFFKGKLSNSKIYNKALSAAEVLQNYEAQKSKFANTIVQQGLVLNLDAGNPYSYAGAGTTIYDVSATSLSWTGSNVTYNSDPIKYFSYNGSSSWLQSSTSAAYDSQTITMECWCYPNTLSQEGFLFEKGSVNTQYSMFFESITNPNFVFRTMGTVSNQSLSFNVNTYLTVSAWNHIVCTYNGSSKIMYVNGVQVASVAASGTLPTGQVNQYIGRHSSGYFLNGNIGESRVYNIALSAAEVLQNYNATKGRFGL
jgi:hypothetical protein